MRPGDVIIYHSGSCSSYSAHATVVNRVSNGVPYVASNSPRGYDLHYTHFFSTKPYAEFLVWPHDKYPGATLLSEEETDKILEEVAAQL
jgi:hypothetical protein